MSRYVYRYKYQFEHEMFLEGSKVNSPVLLRVEIMRVVF